MAATLPHGFVREEPPLYKMEGAPPQDMEVEVPPDETPEGTVLRIVADDGSLTFDFNPPTFKPQRETAAHDDNLAELLSESELASIAGKLIPAIQNDDQSRRGWLDDRAKGIDLLGFKMEQPKGDIANSTAPVEGQATVRHTLLAEAVARFMSNAAAELLPPSGPVKVASDATPRPPGATDAPAAFGDNGGPEWTEAELAGQVSAQQTPDILAEALEADMNHYLTTVDRTYRSDTERMLFWVGFGGSGFKKIYYDPIRRMPVSRVVDAADLIVGDNNIHLHDAKRITHKIMMDKATLVRMQIVGAYRNVRLPTPTPPEDIVRQKMAAMQGFMNSGSTFDPDDADHTIYECYCNLNIPGFEHKDEDGNETGLPLPYRVVIDKDSYTVLEIRRNWKEDDPLCLKKQCFVKYPFLPMGGFYEIGLLHLLGNADRALTAAWRIMLDNGMFTSFPGFLYSEAAGRQDRMSMRIPPGAGMKVQTGGKDIRSIVMGLPYQPLGPAFPAFIQSLEQTAQRVGGIAEINVGEGKVDAPVGTTLALIEQATKVLSAVHIRLHEAQTEEFQLLKEEFRKDPEAFWRYNKRPAFQWQVDQFIQALDDYDLVPRANPNVPSHMHRVMMAQAVAQLAMRSPQLYNIQAVERFVLTMLGVADTDALLNPNPQPPADPAAGGDAAKMAGVQQKQQEAQMENATRQAELAQKAQQSQQETELRAHQAALESADRAADRLSREQIAATRARTDADKLHGELIMHGQPSGDAALSTHGDLLQHTNPSADAHLAAQSAMTQHQNPSGDAQLGAAAAAMKPAPNSGETPP